MPLAFPTPDHMPCPDCGASVPVADEVPHVCDDERQVDFRLVELGPEIAVSTTTWPPGSRHRRAASRGSSPSTIAEVLTDAELDACAALMDEVAVRAMERIVAERPRADQIATKSWAADWVTETDLAVERLVREAIAERFPGHRIEGEEFGVSGDDDAPATWLIDPVDGTTNYVHGLPLSTFSLCVSDEAGAAAGARRGSVSWRGASAVRGRGRAPEREPTRSRARAR